MRLDAEYYISKTLIPPLERIFNLVGANVRSWYEEMRKIQIRDQKGGVVLESLGRRLNGSTIHAFMKSRMCTVCEIHLTDDRISTLVAAHS
jgi:DNA polymerase zeta